MNLTWLDASLLMLLFGVGTVIARSLDRSETQEPQGKVICHRHEWVRNDSEGLICEWCGKIPG